MYDYLIVGAGLFGSVVANELKKKNKKVLVIDKRDHVGGNIYTKLQDGINVHKYGAHIFHTNNKEVWDYINSFAEFNRFTNSPIANYKGKLYNLPFNMNTFYQMWGTITPKQAQEIINNQKAEISGIEPKNLEEKAISLVGKDIYEKLIKGYTQKQWGKECSELPAFIINRLPLRFTYDNNYFNDRFQGIPIGGYTQIIEKMLEGVDVQLGVDYLENREHYKTLAKNIIYTGRIDKYYDCKLGTLEYRSLRFEEETLDTENYQGNAVVNYTEYEIPYTRIIEHKHFENAVSSKTVITREYPLNWDESKEPYYTINNERNNTLYAEYKKLADQESNVYFGGRLGDYKYYDMHVIIEKALELSKNLN